MAFQKNPVCMRGTSEPNGWSFSCSSSEGGDQGSALTGPFCVLTIDPVLKHTESEFKGVYLRAIQEDIALVA